MVILGRTYADGSEKDYAAVNALQAQLKLTPLSQWGKPFTPKAPAVESEPRLQHDRQAPAGDSRDGTAPYFTLMTKLMAGAAPPPAADAPLLARMAKIGIVPGQPFDGSKVPADAQKALAELPKTALAKIGANRGSLGKRTTAG
jgi:hypothetical protein